MFGDGTKVLYITGCGRSGSTLFGNILGCVEGFVSVGEIHVIWERGLISNKACGCGKPFRECEMWRPVFEEAFGGMDRVDPQEIIRLRESGASARHIPLMLTPPGRRLIKRRLAEYLIILSKLYRAVHTVTGSKVIVDTSKIVSYGLALGMVPSVDLRVIHLVRDARAAAYSWLRKKPQIPESPEYMMRRHPAATSFGWIERNLSTEAAWRRHPERYLMLRYEDFVAEPRKAIRQALKLAGEETAPLSHMADHEVELGVNHTVWGNASRFRSGMVEIRPDREWVSRMKPADRRLVTSLTFPLLLYYGYLCPPVNEVR